MGLRVVCGIRFVLSISCCGSLELLDGIVECVVVVAIADVGVSEVEEPVEVPVVCVLFLLDEFSDGGCISEPAVSFEVCDAFADVGGVVVEGCGEVFEFVESFFVTSEGHFLIECVLVEVGEQGAVSV